MQSLSDHAYEQLTDLLADASMTPGVRLPSEIDLSRRFGVSRPVLRQSLERLRSEGRLVSRKGAGTFVGAPASRALKFGPLTSIPDVRSFLEFRCSVESEAAAQAAERHDAQAIRTLRVLRTRIVQAIAAGASGLDEDIAFHMAIAEASGNRFYVLTLSALTDQMRYAVRLIRELSDRPARARFEEVHREHAAIERAISVGDPMAAAAAMRSHLRGGIARLFGN